MQMIKTQILIIIAIVFSISGIAQNDTSSHKKKHHPFFSLNYHYGSVMGTTDFVKGDNLKGSPITNYQSLSFKFGFQNPGYTHWQKTYRGPYYGIGFFMGDFFTKELGYPLAAYGFYGIPIKRWNKLELYSEFQFGLAWRWAHYDSIHNPKNNAIGSNMTVYLDIGLNAFYPITNNLDLGLGLSFTHFSNGGFERPNRGLNLIAPSFELKYHINKRPNTRGIERMPKVKHKSNELYFMLGYGDYQLDQHEFDTNYFAVGGIGIHYSFQHSNAFRSGPGVDFNFSWGLTAKPDGTHGPIGFDNLTIGLIYTPELVIDKLRLSGGVGIYAKHLNYGNFKQLYQRLGARYYFTDHISLGVNIRAINFMLAEFLEFNIGYSLHWSPKKERIYNE